ncbi:triose-phosphate isomerase [Pelagibacterium lentulum]|uniref:Triosephosphate isomerase n=1 Tax=Pelagibacterium lentulum TaxID=2029865 RepID=A0A916RE29_9HYPH|nr:triose-phosphate isomerase [Pelagibacterium lentulum]GGA52543.1 triosephosphate isomerase [Pelagibacterium lentulum]
MSNALRPLIAGNWKMNGTGAALSEVTKLRNHLSGADLADVDILIAPPATLVERFFQAVKGTAIAVGGQDCHASEQGAHTGDVSAQMLADAGATYVIVGHSERRSDYSETDSQVKAKAMAALRAGLTPIVCVGETEAERETGRANQVVSEQLAGSLPETESPDRVVVAYEPVWAIGTGKTPTLADIAAMHTHIRSKLTKRYGAAGPTPRILYGGSVKPANAGEILAIENVDGALVGGASLLADDFFGIISAA